MPATPILPKLSAAALDRLVMGFPETDAAAYRLHWAEQSPWGLGDRPAVIVVDHIEGLLDADCPLGDPETYRPAIEATRRLLAITRRLSWPTVFTVPDASRQEGLIGAWLRGTSADEYTYGAKGEWFSVARTLEAAASEYLIVKPKPSGFFGTQLASILTYHHIDTLVIAGATTNRCLRTTVEDAFAFNYRVVVPIECVGCGIDISNRVELLDMGIHREVAADLIEVDVLLEVLGSWGIGEPTGPTA